MITHPEKVLFPQDGITKGQLAAYYEAIAPIMLPHIRARPVTMERFPSGIEQPGFMHKDVSKGFPEWLERVEVPKRGGTVHHPLVGDMRSLLWLANQNCITPHVWTSRAPNLYEPDICVFDLDPSDDDLDVLRAAALRLRDLLDELGLTSWVKTSGSKGFHIVVPLADGAGLGEVAWFAHAVGAMLVERDPEHLTQEFSKADRGGRIYVDTGRNLQRNGRRGLRGPRKGRCAGLGALHLEGARGRGRRSADVHAVDYGRPHRPRRRPVGGHARPFMATRDGTIEGRRTRARLAGRRVEAARRRDAGPRWRARPRGDPDRAGARR